MWRRRRRRRGRSSPSRRERWSPFLPLRISFLLLLFSRWDLLRFASLVLQLSSYPLSLLVLTCIRIVSLDCRCRLFLLFERLEVAEEIDGKPSVHQSALSHRCSRSACPYRLSTLVCTAQADHGTLHGTPRRPSHLPPPPPDPAPLSLNTQRAMVLGWEKPSRRATISTIKGTLQLSSNDGRISLEILRNPSEPVLTALSLSPSQERSPIPSLSSSSSSMASTASPTTPLPLPVSCSSPLRVNRDCRSERAGIRRSLARWE